MVREGLSLWIARQPDLEVCGDAADVADAMRKVQALAPDLAIIDLSLKSGHGLDLIKRIKGQNTGTKMLVSSVYDERIYAERALTAGAMGYVSKQESPKTVVEAIRQVLAGKVFLSAEMTERLLQRSVGGREQRATPPVENLTDRELEIFTLIGRGLTTRAVADRLHLSVHTIETHRENIKAKLNVHSGAELSRGAVQWVLENG
jgi:DNA-binding NarL/FixJ family response regulator